MKQSQKERFKKAVQRYGSSTGVWFSRSISMWFYPEKTHGIQFEHPELIYEAEKYQPDCYIKRIKETITLAGELDRTSTS